MLILPKRSSSQDFRQINPNLLDWFRDMYWMCVRCYRYRPVRPTLQDHFLCSMLVLSSRRAMLGRRSSVPILG